MNDYVDDWIDYIKKHITKEIDEIEIVSLGYHLSEYWHVKYDINDNEANIDFECYPYWIPNSFKKEFEKIARSWFNKTFNKYKSVILNMLKTSNYRDIDIEYVVLPSFLCRHIKLEYFLGFPVKYNGYNIIRLESPKFAFMMEEKIW